MILHLKPQFTPHKVQTKGRLSAIRCNTFVRKIKDVCFNVIGGQLIELRYTSIFSHTPNEEKSSSFGFFTSLEEMEYVCDKMQEFIAQYKQITKGGLQ